MCRDVQRLFKVQWRFSPSSFWDLTSIAVSAFCLSRQRFFAIFWYIETWVYIMSQCISVHKTPWDVRFQFHAQNGGRSMLKPHDWAEWHQIRILYSDLQGINDPVAAALYPWKLTWPIAQCHGSLIWFTKGDKIHYMQAEGAKDVNYCSQKIRFQIVTSKQHAECILQKMPESSWFIIQDLDSGATLQPAACCNNCRKTAKDWPVASSTGSI